MVPPCHIFTDGSIILDFWDTETGQYTWLYQEQRPSAVFYSNGDGKVVAVHATVAELEKIACLDWK